MDGWVCTSVGGWVGALVGGKLDLFENKPQPLFELKLKLTLKSPFSTSPVGWVGGWMIHTFPTS